MLDHLISERASAIQASGIRRIFNLGASLENPIRLSIGQPDFPVPEPIRKAAISAIESGHNGYTPTQGSPALLSKVIEWMKVDLGWGCAVTGDAEQGQPSVFISSGTSGALVLAFMAMLNPGDECIIPDPYFVAYPHMASICGARAVKCDTYPDFRMTAERVAPLITERTKFVLVNTPSNPCGVVNDERESRELRELCRSKGVLLISDEIYDEFVFDDALTSGAKNDPGMKRCASACREDGAHEDTLLIRGFGKTYACTGWRLGYVAGPSEIVDEMAKLQQYTFVCAPAPLQQGVVACFDTPMGAFVKDYQQRRDLVVETMSAVTEIAVPGGAFYAFVKVPEHLGMTGTRFTERMIDDKVLVIPGGVFSDRDTHFRISYATGRDELERGLGLLARAMS